MNSINLLVGVPCSGCGGVGCVDRDWLILSGSRKNTQQGVRVVDAERFVWQVLLCAFWSAGGVMCASVAAWHCCAVSSPAVCCTCCGCATPVLDTVPSAQDRIVCYTYGKHHLHYNLALCLISRCCESFCAARACVHAMNVLPTSVQ
jgi:hypothetical protein